MVSKIMKDLLSSIYLWISIFILLCFFAAVWFVNNSVEKEAKERSDILTRNVALSNIQIITNMLDDYEEKLYFAEILLNNKETNNLQETIKQIQILDPSIESIYSESIDTLQKHPFKVWRDICKRDNRMYFKFSLITNHNERLCLLVNLLDFHKRVTEIPIVNSAYTTISSNSIYVYHPDESKIGTTIGIQEQKYERRLLEDPKDTIISTTSDYLNLPTYSYYRLENTSGEHWIFTAHLPYLGLSDSIRRTADYFLIISLLAIFSFLLVLGLGVYRWRKETIRRRKIEQENMNLLLKNEQHTQAMISAELERLKSGLNPHFLFNSLSSLRVLINKDIEVAKYFAITLSNLYRYMLQQENQNIVTLREELEFTKDYINLQKIRFSNKIITEITLTEESLSRNILPISLQLLVENCIKHTKISENEPLHIRIYTENEYIVVVNNYNPREYDSSYSGKGIANLIRRYSFLTNIKSIFEIKDESFFAKIPLLQES